MSKTSDVQVQWFGKNLTVSQGSSSGRPFAESVAPTNHGGFHEKKGWPTMKFAKFALKFLGYTHIFSSFCGKFSLKIAGGWEDSCGYGSIPFNTIFSGMNIHESQLFWCELQGYYWFWHTAMSFNFPPLIVQRPRHRRLFSSPDRRQIRGQQGDGNLHPKCQPTDYPTWETYKKRWKIGDL